MNYNRFYGLLGRLPVHTDEMKEQFVLQYTNGRTESLKDMTSEEYNRMCNALDASLKPQTDNSDSAERKARRSTALHLMQKLGIDTTDWARINAFCNDYRIAGMPFGMLTVPELKTLAVTLRTIQRKGGLRAFDPQPKPQLQPAPKPAPASSQQILIMPLDGGAIC